MSQRKHQSFVSSVLSANPKDWQIAAIEELKRAADREQSEGDKSQSVYRCRGSSHQAIRHWAEPKTGVFIGLCEDCGQTVMCYVDLQKVYCCEHVRRGRGNVCSECERTIYDEDYLCVWCRMDITINDAF